MEIGRGNIWCLAAIAWFVAISNAQLQSAPRSACFFHQHIAQNDVALTRFVANLIFLAKIFDRYDNVTHKYEKYEIQPLRRCDLPNLEVVRTPVRPFGRFAFHFYLLIHPAQLLGFWPRVVHALFSDDVCKRFFRPAEITDTGQTENQSQ